ncbi:MAG: class I SAM-dependent methyltransferase, partial [candidate division Zixibacteria bacterium]
NYDNYYDGESDWRRLGAIGKMKNIISLCDKFPHNSILEIGSGEGAILQELSDQRFGESLYSLEISKSALEAIKKRNINSLIECNLFDGYNIPYGDNKFDLAILSHVVEHLEHPRKLLYEASRVAKQVFIEVPLEDNLRLKMDYAYDRVGHINFYSLKTIRRLIQTSGLQILSQKNTNISSDCFKYMFGKKGALRYFLKEFLLRITPDLATKISTYHYSMLCRRKDLHTHT